MMPFLLLAPLLLTPLLLTPLLLTPFLLTGVLLVPLFPAMPLTAPLLTVLSVPKVLF